MRGATGITLQPHQMLRLPRKKRLVLGPRLIWNVIYNAQSNRSHPPTSPSAAPATQNDSHHLSSWHMKRHLQCAEKHASPSNLTKCCPCHEKWCASLIFVTYETLFTMRGATGITLQPHQILRLPRKITLQNQRKICRKQLKRQFQCGDDSNMIRPWSEHDPNMIRPWTRHLAPARSPRLLFALRRRILYWKLQHFARRLSTQISPNTAPATNSDTPTSPNTAPATKNDAHNWLSWHMQRHLQCAEQQASPSNLTKCCACHVKSVSSWVLVSYETSFTMRRATDLILQHHQVLRLPRKMTRIIYPRDIWNVIYNARRNMHHLQPHQMLPLPRKMMRIIDLRHIWNVIYNARSNRHHPPTSPNTAPATQNYTPKSKKNLPKTAEASIPMRGRFEHDPTMIRTWSEHDPNMIRPWTRHLAPARSPRLLFALRRRILYWKLQHFARRLSTQISPNTAPATKSDTPTSPNTAPATKSATPRWRNTAPATKSDTPRSPNTAPATKSDTDLWLYWAVTELLLNWAVTELLLNCYWAVTELLLNCYWTVTQLLLNWPVTELLLNWAVTQLLLDCYWTVTELTCYWAVTEPLLILNWAVTELLLYWAVTWQSCYFTELLLDWAVTLLSCYFTELFLYWAVTWLRCFFTELLLYWAVTLLSCYFTELLLDWAVTSLSCYLTELLLYCYFTELLLYCLSCFFTELFLYWAVTAFLNLRNSEVSQLNFLWLYTMFRSSEGIKS